MDIDGLDDCDNVSIVDDGDAGDDAGDDAGESTAMAGAVQPRISAAAAENTLPRLPHIPPGPCTESWTHFSAVPLACRPDAAGSRPPCMLGVDEAGRGPVLGPMVYAICYAPVAKLDAVKAMGFADSKVLKESQRDALFVRIVQESEQPPAAAPSSDQRASNDTQTEPEAEAAWLGWAVTACTPQDISSAMLKRSKTSLNEVAHDTTIALIRGAIDRGVNVQEVYVDTVGPPEPYQAKLERLFPRIGKIRVTKKADSLFPIVSAASICAKVTRDSMLKHWEFVEHGLETEQASPSLREFGSGYPGDPKTVAWLKKQQHPVFGFPRLVRFSWSTATKLVESPEAVAKHGSANVCWRYTGEGDSASESKPGASAGKKEYRITTRFAQTTASGSAGHDADGRVAKKSLARKHAGRVTSQTLPDLGILSAF
ncbi:ribonuclease H-like domain-containing protein [Entophlyctis helioformis]|nr:ribonuclease H-like domain-containing protein [Entophlyctis helioformis]